MRQKNDGKEIKIVFVFFFQEEISVMLCNIGSLHLKLYIDSRRRLNMLAATEFFLLVCVILLE